MQRIEALEEYNRAQRLGVRDYREKTAAGKYPYLPALDELLEKTDTESQIPLGTIEIPLDYVVGTKTTGRTPAFASNFMPLLPENTEFASKWVSLCMAHVEEGIHDAIKAYEYMGRFYVQEGNKRVSVLKYFGADSIFATVTRVVPQFNDTPEIREYYEFMDYYPLCGLYRLHFTQEGSFARLQKALGKAPDEKWTADDKAEVVSLMNWITKAYNAHGGDKMRTTPADVMLLLLRLYKLDELKTYSPAQFAAAIDAVWDDVLALERPEPVKLSTQPSAPAKKNSLLDRILPGIRSELLPGPASTSLAVPSWTRCLPARWKPWLIMAQSRAKMPMSWWKKPSRTARIWCLQPRQNWWGLRCARRCATRMCAS